MQVPQLASAISKRSDRTHLNLQIWIFDASWMQNPPEVAPPVQAWNPQVLFKTTCDSSPLLWCAYLARRRGEWSGRVQLSPWLTHSEQASWSLRSSSLNQLWKNRTWPNQEFLTSIELDWLTSRPLNLLLTTQPKTHLLSLHPSVLQRHCQLFHNAYVAHGNGGSSTLN